MLFFKSFALGRVAKSAQKTVKSQVVPETQQFGIVDFEEEDFELPELDCNYLTRSLSHHKELEINHFTSGVNCKPHPDKVHKGGEDAYCVQDSLLAVADGVGGWAEVGVDPSEYSRTLCKNLEDYFRDEPNFYTKDPKSLIKHSTTKTRVEGSSTLCVVTLDPKEARLRASYVGDAGYVILRRSTSKQQLQVVHQSTEQLKSFNYPYQLGMKADDPDVAVEESHEIQNNDIIVVGSDGLFDNMSAEQIASCINPFTDNEKGDILDKELVAEIIAETARSLSLDRKYNSPFAKKAAESAFSYIGGKSDDITVVVGQVKIRDVSSPEQSVAALD